MLAASLTVWTFVGLGGVVGIVLDLVCVGLGFLCDLDLRRLGLMRG